MSMSSRSIGAQLAALDATAAELNAEADRLSLPAVEGDAAATAALSDVMARLRQAQTDRGILERARDTAWENEAASAAAVDKVERARHRAIAREHAVRLVELAEAADEVVARAAMVLAELAAVERDVWRELHLSGDKPFENATGRRAVNAMMVGELQAVIDGRHRFGRPPIAGSIRSAWAFITESGDA